ncbi:MAG: hypothetical protein O9333_01135, partial [Beijerinckiaceae bacterium]|nr:hypothetical protein [Beijerinckiaceae bacterium]
LFDASLLDSFQDRFGDPFFWHARPSGINHATIRVLSNAALGVSLAESFCINRPRSIAAQRMRRRTCRI